MTRRVSRNELVVVALRGRLGNQLFSFALGRALHPDGPVPLDNLMEPDTRDLEAALVPGAFRLIDSREALTLRQPPRMRGRRRTWTAIDRRTERFRRAREYHEQVQGECDPAVFELSGPVILKGFFQNEGYFLPVAERIVEDLRGPTSAFHEHHAIFRSRVGPGPTVAVVVRAGSDYEEVGWAQRFEWYQRAARWVTERVPSPRFAVFSDIPVAGEAVAAAFQDLGPAVPLVRLDTLTQLHLIAAMDHAILAASSFAWWGAWLGDFRRTFSADRIVIAPEPWGAPILNRIPPARWERLSHVPG